MVNSLDRMIRTFDVTFDPVGLEFANKYHDAVDKIQWVQCRFSKDEEYVLGASAAGQKHKIYLWDRALGNLVRVLDGPNEGFMDMVVPEIHLVASSFDFIFNLVPFRDHFYMDAQLCSKLFCFCSFFY